jgi:DNA polymerase I-like protein with 3'-5' exonuclease and polymerase domains
VTQKVRRLTYYRSATLTGRIRNYCSYTELRNHRFQAVAADGAKMAMFRIMRLADTKKWKLLNFVHDELGVALPASQAPKLLKEVERIMITEMEKVLGHGVPVAVEGSIAPCWSKS